MLYIAWSPKLRTTLVMDASDESRDQDAVFYALLRILYATLHQLGYSSPYQQGSLLNIGQPMREQRGKLQLPEGHNFDRVRL